eukprot:TRINITY_DN2424_c0_g1_i3.p1 TRINITY_DN2424_c0_g1~~TRINITY_DN2424_c0_g1_i3.p1  ORF type:complete len:156 (-),score=36.83 TRINITY_DN2424_c0_g1_i3:104-571(-)
MTMYSNSMSSDWKRRIAQENRQVLASLNRQKERNPSKHKQPTPAHHSAPFACDLEASTPVPPPPSQRRPSRNASRTASSRPSTASSACSFATGYSSQRCPSRAEALEGVAGVSTEHEVLKQLAALESKLTHERQARLEMESEVNNLRGQLKSQQR